MTTEHSYTLTMAGLVNDITLIYLDDGRVSERLVQNKHVRAQRQRIDCEMAKKQFSPILIDNIQPQQFKGLLPMKSSSRVDTCMRQTNPLNDRYW